ncbi:MAG: DNA translocase FtsK 4TM domain-containing protein [Anaerolineales bacterium]|nr:DNA translocase FtsK 4TM domain-containing protein [Anaerolineales bacterium]
MPTQRRKSKTPSRNTRSGGSARGQRASSSARSSPRSTAYSRQPVRSATRSRRATRTSLLGRLGAALSSLRRSRPAPKPAARTRKSAPLAQGMSLDRKLDLVGVLMLFAGLITLLILFSSTNSVLTGGFLYFLWRAFGWGTYLFPIALGFVGLWLVLRNFERVPQLAVERLFGLLLLYVNLLAWIHFFHFPSDAYALASQGLGGGYVGALFFKFLHDNLGWGGAVIALLAWLLIALALALDVSVVTLFRWLPPWVERLQDGLQDWLDERRNHRQDASNAPRPLSSPAQRQPPGLMPAQPLAPGVQAGVLTASPVRGPRPWVLPNLDDILDPGGDVSYDDELDRQRARLIEDTLAAFGAPVNVVEVNRGPTITQFGVEPDFIDLRTGRTRVRVGKIAALADDLALALAARTIRVEAPVPGKGYVGIEVPNESIALVAMRDVVESEAFRRLKSSLRFALGQDVAGNAFAADLAAMPHLLIAGATGSGKSVCVNALICCLLLHNTPDDLRILMVDPKRVELTNYNGIPHLMTPVVVDLERVVGALQWVLREMDMRYSKLAEQGARNIVEYNARLEAHGGRKLPRLVVIVDELADLMMLAPDDTERSITRLAQLARATGIHLVLATQRPSVDVVTGLIKANFPARIAFAVASGVDSRVILDQPGAERLLGRGDMLFQSPDASAPIRLQGAFVSEAEIQRLVSYWQSFVSSQAPAPSATGGIPDAFPAGIPLKQMPFWDEMKPEEDQDPLLEEAIDLSRRQGRASISMLQRRLRIGYTRASRLVETMQEKGLIGTNAGPLGFEILDYGPAAPPVDEG